MGNDPLTPVLAVAAAVLTVILLGYFAHDVLGISRANIRMAAIGWAVLIGIVVAGNIIRKRAE
jgi:membrane protein DedA with SNARE-associated domain